MGLWQLDSTYLPSQCFSARIHVRSSHSQQKPVMIRILPGFERLQAKRSATELSHDPDINKIKEILIALHETI